MQITIIKRDGSKESFQPEKIIRVVEAAGVSQENAKVIVHNIQGWIMGLQKHELTSLEVRDQVIEELKKIDAYAANMFIWYQKTKDTSSEQGASPQ